MLVKTNTAAKETRQRIVADFSFYFVSHPLIIDNNDKGYSLNNKGEAKGVLEMPVPPPPFVSL